MRAGDLDRFYGRHAPIYDATRRFFLFDRELAVERLDVRAGQRVLDFGCGTGLNFPYLARFAPASVTGVDFSAAMLERARAKATGGATVVRGDVSTIRFDERADRILCTYALSMIETWRETIRNMHRHLEPTGSVVILDFHTLEGALRFVNPLWSWWFARFGVRPGLDLVPVLRELFADVDVLVRRSGYNVLIRASAPKPVA